MRAVNLDHFETDAHGPQRGLHERLHRGVDLGAAERTRNMPTIAKRRGTR